MLCNCLTQNPTNLLFVRLATYSQNQSATRGLSLVVQTDPSLPTITAFKLNGGVMNIEFGKSSLHFFHDRVSLTEHLIFEEDVCAEGNIVRANFPGMKIVQMLIT